MQFHRGGQLLLEAVALGVEGHALARPADVQLVGVVDEDDRWHREHQSGDAEEVVEQDGQEGEGGARQVARQGPLVVLAPDRQRTLARAQGDNAGKHHGVGHEVHGRRQERRHDDLQEAGVRRYQGHEDDAGHERREYVVRDVEDDLLRVPGDAERRSAGHGRHHHGRPQTKDSKGGKDGDERHPYVAHAREADLAHVGDSGQDGERDERPGERHAFAVGHPREARDGGQRHRADIERNGRACPPGRCLRVTHAVLRCY